jgi:predicted PurR-regulated permease PerM
MLIEPSEKPAAPIPAVDWTPRKIVLFTLTAILGVATLAMILDFVPAITWAIAVCVATYRPYRWLAMKVKSPSVASILAVALVLVLLIAPAVFLFYTLSDQVLALISLFRSGAAQDWAANMLDKYPHLNQSLARIQEAISFKDGSQAAAGYFAGKLQGILTGSIRIITQVIIMLFTLFFLYRDGEQAREGFKSLLPLRREQADFLVRRIADTISSSLLGRLLIVTLQGSLGGLMLWILNVPNPLLWAFMMGLLAFIPALGTFLIWMPLAVFLAVSGHVVKAIILLAWGLGVVGTVDNLLYPKLVGDRLKLHTVLTFFAVLGGLSIFGLSGLVIGPILLTATIAILQFWSPDILPSQGNAEASPRQ